MERIKNGEDRMIERVTKEEGNIEERRNDDKKTTKRVTKSE